MSFTSSFFDGFSRITLFTNRRCGSVSVSSIDMCFGCFLVLTALGVVVSPKSFFPEARKFFRVESISITYIEMSAVNIPDKPFHLDFPPIESGGASILLLGSGRAGKTTALKYIIDNCFKKHVGVIFSQSAKAAAYKDMKYPLLPLCSAYVPELMNDAYKINRETKNHYPFLFVLDDMPLVKNDRELLKLLTIYRNSGISGIVGVQSPTLLNPTTRSNFTVVMLGHNNTMEQTEQVIKGWLRGRFPPGWSYDMKCRWFEEQTKDFHFLVINNWTNEIFRTKIDLSK
jgi:hypothetical protein